jgi:hypothetical protein
VLDDWINLSERQGRDFRAMRMGSRSGGNEVMKRWKLGQEVAKMGS